MIRKLILLLAVLSLAACNEAANSDPASETKPIETASPPEAATAANAVTAEVQAESKPRLTLEQIQQELNVPHLSRPWTGDLDGMLERRVIRVLTVYGLGRYYVDHGQEKGITYELFKMFEDTLNKGRAKNHIRIHVVVIPGARHQRREVAIELRRGGQASVQCPGLAGGLVGAPDHSKCFDPRRQHIN